MINKYVDLIFRDLSALQPITDTYCWCCLRGASDKNPLHQCKKCGLYCHLQCSDPVCHDNDIAEVNNHDTPAGELVDGKENAKNSSNQPFICFTCEKCAGCGTEVSFYGRWEQATVCDEIITCCEECKESYNAGLFCNVCLHTVEAGSVEESCYRCSECNCLVHHDCNGDRKSRKNRRDDDIGRSRENSIADVEEDTHQSFVSPSRVSDIISEDRSEEHTNIENHDESNAEDNSVINNNNNNNNLVGNPASNSNGTNHYSCPSCRRVHMSEVLKRLSDLDSRSSFQYPITEDIAPHYFKSISPDRMMYFNLMRERIHKKQYTQYQQLRDDFELMCSNAFQYNTVGDDVWNGVCTMFDEGEIILDECLKGTVLSRYGINACSIRTSRIRASTRPETSPNARRESQAASKMGRMIEDIKAKGGKLPPLVPLPAPYSATGLSIPINFILYKYSNTITIEACASCGSCGDRDKMLFCCDWGEAYHVFCAGSNNVVTHEMRCGWRCKNCKICEICGLSLALPMKEETMICVCNCCDRYYHRSCIYCSEETDLSLLVCGHCFQCSKCGVKGTPTTWSYHKEFCRSCYLKEERFHLCAICNRPWNAGDESLCYCESCDQWIHRECISKDQVEWEKTVITRTPYSCVRCREKAHSSSRSEKIVSSSLSAIPHHSNSEVLTTTTPSTIPTSPSSFSSSPLKDRLSAVSSSSLHNHNHNSIHSGTTNLVNIIQGLRQEYRLRELIQGDSSFQAAHSAALEPYVRDFARVVIRVGRLM